MASPSLSAFAGFERKLVVGVGGMAVSNDTGLRLTTYSLGSCLGITVYDPVARAGGLLHAMLPNSDINPAKGQSKPGMFLDTGIPALLRAAYELHAERHRLLICLAGGAQVLNDSQFFNIGARNYDYARDLLRSHGFRVRAEDVGGSASRTLTLELGTGVVRLRTAAQTTESILFVGCP